MQKRGPQAPKRGAGKRIEPHFGERRAAPKPKRKPAAKRKASSRGPSWLAPALRYALMVLIWGLIVLGGAIVYFVEAVPDPILAALDDRPPNLTILAADGTVLAERGLRRGHVRLDALPPYLIKAVLATEDRRFYSHMGVDPIGLVRAAFTDIEARGVREGGSTITQQLAKNLFLTPNRTLARKLEEAIYAIWLEQRFDKDEILELYLNRVYFGGGTYGVEAAAEHYFGKSARSVTLPEAALLAGLLKAPSKYSPTRSVKRASERLDEVLNNMVEAGYLSEAEARAAASQPIRLTADGDETGYPYAVDWVAELLPDYIGDNEGDLIIDTSIDAGLQRAAQKALRTELDSVGGTLDASEGAVVVLDPEGGVKAVVGGRSYQASPFDRALKAMRQPGSAFKPFVYLTALESGYTPDSVATDEPITIDGWSPKNHTGSYHGEMTFRDALAHSVNTIAVQVAANVGRWRVVRTAHRLGIQSKLNDQPSMALGTSEVTLLELTSAYVPFANGGIGVLPHIITRIRNGDGKVLYARRESTVGQVIATPYVAAMNDMLSATVAYGTGKAAALPDRAVAGKTGTSQDFRDAWFVGYTADYVGGVWIGNDDASKMHDVTGGSLPARVWHEIMLYADQGKPPRALPGAQGPRLEQAANRVPASEEANGGALFRRVLSVLSGG